VSREEAYEHAAVYYRMAGCAWDAARCYRLAGAHRRAAEIYESIGEHADAAAAFGEAGLPELGAWLLARVDQPGRARELLGPPEGALGLRYRLIIARCEIAEGVPADSICPLIGDVCAVLEDRSARPDPLVEEWAVMLSEAAARYDQAALVFAAAVRGGRYGAAQRWNAWSMRVLGTEVVVPPTPTAA
jgi:hypothetical protein